MMTLSVLEWQVLVIEMNDEVRHENYTRKPIRKFMLFEDVKSFFFLVSYYKFNYDEDGKICFGDFFKLNFFFVWINWYFVKLIYRNIIYACLLNEPYGSMIPSKIQQKTYLFNDWFYWLITMSISSKRNYMFQDYNTSVCIDPFSIQQSLIKRNPFNLPVWQRPSIFFQCLTSFSFASCSFINIAYINPHLMRLEKRTQVILLS